MPRRRRSDIGRQSRSSLRRAISRAKRANAQRETDNDNIRIDSNVSKAGSDRPFGIQHLDLCRVCAEFTNNCIAVTDKDRPYLTRNKTALTLNDLSVELDFNNALPITVCRICDKKLEEMYDFIKQVKEAQDSLIRVRDYVKEDIENIIVKTECESPTPVDNEVDDIDSKDGILDYLTVSETVFVKPISNYKKKGIEDTPRSQKTDKVTENVESEESKFIINIKEETTDMVDACEAENSEVNYTETATEPSELELATRAFVSKMSDNEMVMFVLMSELD